MSEEASRILLRLLKDAPAAPSFHWLRPRFARALGICIPKEPVANLWITCALGSTLNRTLATLEEAGLIAGVRVGRRRLWMLTEKGRREVEEAS